ncbi:MAG: hypothetical protein ACFFDH_05025 [Promethearchaeota archaeon]
MAQVKRNKDVRKNCVDIEKVINDLLESSKREEVLQVVESSQSSKLNKKLLKFYSKYNSKFHQELIPIEKVKYKYTYRNFPIY